VRYVGGCFVILHSSRVRIPFFLASFDEQRASVTSELQHSDVDSLLTFWEIFIVNSAYHAMKS